MGKENEPVCQGDRGNHQIIGAHERAQTGELRSVPALFAGSGVIERQGDKLLLRARYQSEISGLPYGRAAIGSVWQLRQYYRVQGNVRRIHTQKALDELRVALP